MAQSGYLSIDIGSCNIKAIEGSVTSEGINIDKLFMIPTPENAIEAGKFIDFENVANELRTAIKANGIKAKQVICTMDTEAIVTREIQLPLTHPDDMRQMIEYEFTQYLPIKLEDYALEYRDIGQADYGSAEMRKFRVSAMPRISIETTLGLIEALKLKPFAMDTNTNAISKIFEMAFNKGIGSSKTFAFLDLGHVCNITGIAKGGRLLMAKNSPFGMKQIDERIIAANGVDALEADRIKHQVDLTKLSPDRSNIAVLEVLDEIAEALQALFKFYLTRAGENDIDELLLFGGGANIKGIESYFIDKLTMKVRKVNLHTMVDCPGGCSANLIDYCSAIGALIRKEGTV